MKLNWPLLVTMLLVFTAPAFASDGFPEYVAKNLYAEQDLRGKQAPPLQVQKWLSGAAPETKGKVVLIDFWATWCPPCRALIPELNQFKEKFGDDLVVIGISGEKEDTVREFMKKTPMQYNVAVDPDKTMFSTIGIHGIPNVMIITPDNVVRWQGFPMVPADQLSEAKIAQIIAASKSK